MHTSDFFFFTVIENEIYEKINKERKKIQNSIMLEDKVYDMLCFVNVKNV